MKTSVLLTVVMGALLLGGCVGTTVLGVLDESTPEDQRCPLEVRNNLSVVLFDNEPVEWDSKLTNDKFTIDLPPGGHTFMTKYYITENYGYGGSRTRTVTANVSMEFLPGHSYRIYRQDIWLLFLTLRNVKIKEVQPKAKAQSNA